jgi:hypothetical protein
MFFLSETEEGFIKLFSKPINDVSEGETTPSEEKKEIIAKDDSTPPTDPENIHNLRLLLKVNYLLPTLKRKANHKLLTNYTHLHLNISHMLKYYLMINICMACVVQMLYAYVYILCYEILCINVNTQKGMIHNICRFYYTIYLYQYLGR